MNQDERQQYVSCRLESAKTTFNAASVLVENGFWNSAVNRLYYSLYYAVNAVLVMQNIHTKTHAGTKTKFSEYFVKTGKFDKKYGRCYPNFTIGDREVTTETSSNTTANR
jgi:uncharacterized protein